MSLAASALNFLLLAPRTCNGDAGGPLVRRRRFRDTEMAMGDSVGSAGWLCGKDMAAVPVLSAGRILHIVQASPF